MKEFEDDDPMEIQAMFLPGGDPEIHARTVIEEFLMMGMKGPQLMEMFRDPFYLGTFQLYQSLGERRIQELVEDAQTGMER